VLILKRVLSEGKVKKKGLGLLGKKEMTKYRTVKNKKCEYN